MLVFVLASSSAYMLQMHSGGLSLPRPRRRSKPSWQWCRRRNGPARRDKARQMPGSHGMQDGEVKVGNMWQPWRSIQQCRPAIMC